VRLSIFGFSFTIGLVFLAWISTFRDLAQLSGLRFKSLLVLLVLCAYLWIDLEGKVATAAVAALFWTELLDFFIFTFLVRKFKSLRGTVCAIVISDVLTIPALWFFLLSFAGYSISDLPREVLVVQYCALVLLYVALGVIFLQGERWRHYLSVREVRGQ
jgi:hypothetical protein